MARSQEDREDERLRWQLPSGVRIASFIVGLLVLTTLIGGLLWLGAGRDQRGDSDQFSSSEQPGSQRIGSTNLVSWATWGRSASHDRFVRDSGILPSFDSPDWTWQSEAKIEYGLVTRENRVFVPVDDGRLVALDRTSGRVLWSARTAGPASSAPLVVDDLVFVGSREGVLHAFGVADGLEKWRFVTKGPIQSSPIHADGMVIFGSHDRNLYAVDIRTHRAKWVLEGEAEFKGSPSRFGKVVYAGNYDGNLYAVRVSDGKLLWKTQTRRQFAFGGALYSTPTVAWGRVFVGSTDGRVYALGADSGDILWVQSTGDWVYGSPGVAQKKVFIGSYDGIFYALDAETGDERWKFEADDRIASSPSIIDGIVYFSTLGGTTYGLDIRDGSVEWSTDQGRTSGLITDGEWVILGGANDVFGYQTNQALKKAGAIRVPNRDM